jgi:hypothetical protein
MLLTNNERQAFPVLITQRQRADYLPSALQLQRPSVQQHTPASTLPSTGYTPGAALAQPLRWAHPPHTASPAVQHYSSDVHQQAHVQH